MDLVPLYLWKGSGLVLGFLENALSCLSSWSQDINSNRNEYAARINLSTLSKKSSEWSNLKMLKWWGARQSMGGNLGLLFLLSLCVDIYSGCPTYLPALGRNGCWRRCDVLGDQPISNWPMNSNYVWHTWITRTGVLHTSWAKNHRSTKDLGNSCLGNLSSKQSIRRFGPSLWPIWSWRPEPQG